MTITHERAREILRREYKVPECHMMIRAAQPACEYGERFDRGIHVASLDLHGALRAGTADSIRNARAQVLAMRLEAAGVDWTIPGRITDDEGFPQPVWEGERRYGSGESWTYLAVWDNDHIRPELRDCAHDADELCEALTGDRPDSFAHYGGPGRGFTDVAYVHVGRFHTTLRHGGGLDV